MIGDDHNRSVNDKNICLIAIIIRIIINIYKSSLKEFFLRAKE